MGDEGVVEFAFGGFGFGGGVGARVTALGHHHPPIAHRFDSGWSVHRVAVGAHSVGNNCMAPGYVV